MKTHIRFFLYLFAFIIHSYGYASSGDTSLVLIVNPIAEILCRLDPANEVDVRIQRFSGQFSRKVYDYLVPFEEVSLRTQYDELLRLKEQIAADNREGFIKGVLELVPYKPDAYLFASIDKTIDKVVFRAEIIDLSSEPLAVASSKIGFSEFLNDDFVQRKIQILSNSLIQQIKNDIKKCGFISFNDYIRKHSKFSIGFGFGYQKGDHIALGNIPSDLRTVPPHPDDVKYRPDDILDPNNPDNYLIIENTVHVALERRISLDVHFCFWGILNIAIQTSEIKGSEVIEVENLYRKTYIKEGFPGGDALIYYLVRSKNRSFFDGNSLSLPIYITYPVFYFGKNKEVILRLIGGTNLLLPDKISLEAEKGWDRFNERQKETTFDLGELKETEFFAGFDIEGAFAKSIRFGLQFTLVYTEYQEDFSVPLSLQQSNEVLPSLRLNLTKLFGSK